MVRAIKIKNEMKNKDGFTLIEVMLVLGITGLILIGLLGGTFSSIAHQRYNDAYRSFDEYLSRRYSEVISPETLGAGNSTTEVILGKILVFDKDDNEHVYSATLIGEDGKYDDNTDFVASLAQAHTSIACGKREPGAEEIVSTMEQYTLLWQAELKFPNSEEFKNQGKANEQFTGSVIIARTPNSSTVHTIYSEKTYNLKEDCEPTNAGASSSLKTDLLNQSIGSGDINGYFRSKTIDICVKSDDSAVVRAIRIAEDGRNTSAVTTLTEEESPCE